MRLFSALCQLLLLLAVSGTALAEPADDPPPPLDDPEPDDAPPDPE